MKTTSLAPWLCAALINVTAGCALELTDLDDKSAQSSKYGTLNNYMSRSEIRAVSPLMTIDRVGRINVCIEVYGNAPADFETDIREAVQYAADSWNDMLNQPSPPNGDGVTFPPWNRRYVTIEFTCQGWGLYYVYGDMNNDRAFAYPSQRSVTLDASCAWSQYRLWNVMAHEYGHLMGLADTYTEAAAGLDVYGQPSAMMQNADGFTDDDRAGIWNLWRFLVYGGNPCGPGYVEQATNSWGTYCLPTANQWDTGWGSSSVAGIECTNTCRYANDGECDDGGPQSDYSVCDLGTDCSDCGTRAP